MSKQTVLSYEVHILVQGAWRIDSMFDDFDLAERAATQAIHSTFRPLAVRVVKQALDPVTNLITDRTVFRWSRSDEQNQRDETETRRQPSDYSRSNRATRPPEKPKAGPNLAWLSALFLILVCGGIAALIGFDYLVKRL
ncbi:MAG TPA: hypothetical protein VNT30_03655 [Stellaceae bacterium]|nr:hypothetical protein [Stellaceae bacterium]